MIVLLPLILFSIYCIKTNIIGEGVNIEKDEKRCTPEPNLIALSNSDIMDKSDVSATKNSNEIDTEKKLKSSSNKDDKIVKQLLEELNKMKFSSQPNFDLD